MITSAFIGEMRHRVGDSPVKHDDRIVGDGSTTTIKTRSFPVMEGSYKLYVNNTLKTEGAASGYTLDKDTGDIVLAAATSATVRIVYQSAKFRDQWWLETIQSSVRGFGESLFRTVIRSTSSMALSANKDFVNAPSDCIMLTEVRQSSDYTISGQFTPLETNHYYDKRSKKLILGSNPSRSNYLSVSYLRRVAVPTATSSTLDLEDSWLTLLEHSVQEKYARARALALAQEGSMSVEEGHISIQNLRALANDHAAMYRDLLRKIKPIMPSITIPLSNPGAGHVMRP